MSTITEIAILVLAAFVGFEVISKVPNTLHTPLMSGTNAIHGIVLLGGLLLMHEAPGVLEHVLLVIAIAFGTINVIGGFFVTDRMLAMFKKKPERAIGGRGRNKGRSRRRRPIPCRSGGLPAEPELRRRVLHRRVLAVHLRDERADRAADGGARQSRSRRSGWRSR